MSAILPVRRRNAIVDVGVAARHTSIVRLLLLLSLLLSLLGLLLLMLLLLGLLLLSLLLGLLLLLSGGGGRSSLVGVLLVMARLLVHPGRIRLGIKLVVAVDVRGWHHPGGFGGCVMDQQWLEEYFGSRIEQTNSLFDGSGGCLSTARDILLE